MGKVSYFAMFALMVMGLAAIGQEIIEIYEEYVNSKPGVEQKLAKLQEVLAWYNNIKYPANVTKRLSPQELQRRTERILYTAENMAKTLARELQKPALKADNQYQLAVAALADLEAELKHNDVVWTPEELKAYYDESDWNALKAQADKSVAIMRQRLNNYHDQTEKIRKARNWFAVALYLAKTYADQIVKERYGRQG
jgi:hypothetical protein